MWLARTRKARMRYNWRMDKSKICTKCRMAKPLTGFYKEPRASDGRTSQCKTCHDKQTLRWRSEHQERSREYAKNTYRRYPAKKKRDIWLVRKHGITSDDYQAMFDSQGGKCAICGKPQETTMHVDHSHVTGRIRGLLCGKCNRALGYMDDDVGILQNAVAYLRDR